ncbi:putative Multi-domain non-ribosomal peptide synthetase [Nitrospira sp. KM1]|nr:putative Multi-domain non-ribosomal peptide synthetase [Nitrospira sp. KM1]
MEDSAAQVILTDELNRTIEREQINDESVEWVTVRQLLEAGRWTAQCSAPFSSLAYLQYTSGSTSSPRGVMISHENVLSQCQSIIAVAGIDSESRSLCWLPYFHDYGLIHGIIAPFYAGIPALLMSSLTFLRRPLRWLDAIDRHHITHSGAPNFAYEHCVKALQKQPGWKADLRRWVVASCGAEPIQAETVERFTTAFAPSYFSPFAFRPSYGLAETTLMVSTTALHQRPVMLSVSGEALEANDVHVLPGQDMKTRTLVGCGRPIPGMEVRIVNPVTRRLSQPSEVGEIWVSGTSVGQGYWERPELSSETFRASLDGQDRTRYLRTGDLGFLHEGQIFVTGRLKDLIILNGRNLYPNDLEAAVGRCDPRFRSGGCAAFSVEADGTERLIIVLEIDKKDGIAIDAVSTTVRLAVAEQFDVPVWEVLLVRTATIPRTSSGKIQRHACRKAYLERALPVLASSSASAATLAHVNPSGHRVEDDPLSQLQERVEPIEVRIAQLFADQLGTVEPQIDKQIPIVNFGLDSLNTSLIKHKLEDEFGIDLSFSELFGPGTIHDLARAIALRTDQAGSNKTAARIPDTGTGDVEQGESAETHTSFPLSTSQERLWFLEQIHPGGAFNHVSLTWEMEGSLDTEAFTVAVETLLARHDALRLAFSPSGDRVSQSVSAQVCSPVRYCSLVEMDPTEAANEYRRLSRQEATVPFDLAKPPLLRILIVHRSERTHTCILTIHRLIADGWTLRLFCRELAALYSPRGIAKQAVTCQAGAASYIRYIRWQQDRMHDARRRIHRSYWQEALNRLPPPVELPAERMRPRVPLSQGGARSKRLPQELTTTLRMFCRRHGITPFMMCYSIFAGWVHRVTGMADIAIGSVMANRPHPQWEDTFGYFANTVILRMDFSGVETVQALLSQSRRMIMEAYDHQEVPFEQVVATLNQRSQSSPRLFNLMIVWEDDPVAELTLKGITSGRVSTDDVAVEFDLILLVVNGPQNIELVFLYDKALFDGGMVERMLGQLIALLEGVIADPERQLSAIPLMDTSERTLLLTQWGTGQSLQSLTQHITHILDREVEHIPNHMAVICGDFSMSYGDLFKKVNQLAGLICTFTKGRQVRIGLCVERSTLGLVGILGILKAGCAYVPIDPSAPKERQRLVVEDADLSLLVSQRHLTSHLPLERHHVIELESVAGLTHDIGRAPLPMAEPDDLAYLIYTSGSTGRPKGVEITHGALSHSLSARLAQYPDPVTCCLLTFPWSFDGSITSIFWTLLHGGTLVIPTEDQHRDPQQLVRLISEFEITHLILIPSLYEAMLRDTPAERLAPLRTVVTAGEVLSPNLVRRHYERVPQAPLYNEYGPTEATVWTTVYRTNGTEQGARIPIGKPIANSSIYVLDGRMQPVPIGMAGEIYVGGGGLARGYHGQPKLTADAFVAHPYESGSRLYRTGDLGRFRDDGNLEFLGRRDQQIKLRGFRIELGEIESLLRQLPDVMEAACLLHDHPVSGPFLIAFVTTNDPAAASESSLLERLGEKAPTYMMPATVHVMDSLPLLPNGKVDRMALKERAASLEPQTMASALPRDPVELGLTDIWSEVLGKEGIDVNRNFFTLGGHSLLATQVISRIRDTFQVELPLQTLFDAPTVAGMAHQIRALQRGKTSSPVFPPIVPVARTASLPLSYSQQRMWFVQRLAPESTAYNLLFVSRQRGTLNNLVLRQVVDILSRRHEAFRTTFAMTAAGLVQRIAPWQSPHLAEIDLRRLPRDQREAEARRLAEEEGRRTFDLERGPLARVSVIRLDLEDYLLVLNLHHIVGDQWSFGILGRDFAAYYNALCQAHPLPELSLPVQYADYAVWQRHCLTEEILAEQVNYWATELNQLPILYVPTDFPRPAVQTFRGAYCAVDIPQSVIENLTVFSAERNMTSFMVMLACFQLLMSRYSGQTDLAVGFPIANRTQLAMEQLIGTFVNTLVLRVNVDGDSSFSAFAEHVKARALGAFAHQDYPFDRLVETLQVDRDPSTPPLVQVLFNMVNAPIGDIHLYGLKWEPFEVEPGSSQFDLAMTIELHAAKKAYLTFNTDLFTRQTAERLLDHYIALLQQALSNPSTCVDDLPILNTQERRQMLELWNDTVADNPRSLCFSALFESVTRFCPDAVAVSMQGESLTYRELNHQANTIARLLQLHGVAAETPVGLCMDRSLDMVAALLAVMKSGGCYVPLDPDYPAVRIRFMTEDSGAAVVLTTASLTELFTGLPCIVLALDAERDACSTEDGSDLPSVAMPDDLAYILYTSGSTGRPKGVEIRHRSLVNFLWSMKQKPGCTDHDVVLAVTTLSFDIAGLELFLPLLCGARVEIVSRMVASDGRQLRECLDRSCATIMQATPATWRLLLESGWTGNKKLTALCGGEALPADLAHELLSRTKTLWNMYGPTETTIWSTIERMDPAIPEVTVGRPIANTEIYVLDRRMEPVPPGVTGEIYIGGEGLARGYHRRPELTAERFVAHPFTKRPGARLFRTGDLGRYRSDGRLVHLGRADHQVKIRGYRIETGEIESVLHRHPKIQQAVVTARDDKQGMKHLVAYLIAQDHQCPAIEEMRGYLKSLLPDYMIPSYFVFLDRFPLTANNKLDRRALPAPVNTAAALESPYVAPRTAMEIQLTALWQHVLGIQRIGIHDNFFDLGGHSLKAAQLFFQLEAVYGRQLPLATLFQAPTIRELAVVLTQAQWSPPWQSLIAIQPGGSLPPLFMVPGVGGNVLVFAQLAKFLGIDQPMYGLQARGLDGKEEPFTSVPDMAAHYVSQIRRIQGQGPYHIAGACTGGLIAYEMAQQLLASGETARVIMMDTWHPDSYRRHRHQRYGKLVVAPLIVGKIALDLQQIAHQPVAEWWPLIRRKSSALYHLFSVADERDGGDRDFQIQRLTQATLIAVAHYRVCRLGGQVLNVVASRRQVDEVITDTRHGWAHSGNQDSYTVSIPAEDSGRLFVSPHVEPLAGEIRNYLHSHKPSSATHQIQSSSRLA